MKIASILALFVWFTVTAASAAALANADIIKMCGAKLDESIVIASINNSETEFDVSSQGLIDLSNEKVPATVIAAMIKRSNASAKTPSPSAESNPATGQPQTDLMSPSDVLIVDGGVTKPMRYLNPQVRSAARALGFGGFATYASLYGTAASARTRNTLPTFLVSVPNQAQPQSYVTLASLAVRRNNTREVMIGGGYMSYSSGITSDRVIPADNEVLPDQAKAQKGFTIYKITPRKPLLPGEYAVVLYTGEMHGLVSAWFSVGANSYFDFGVDR
jgi:hypothetical protein